jgi:formate hydrogenlyase subunit 6/NADH:ubiquinone oxidoreductase subunit I
MNDKEGYIMWVLPFFKTLFKNLSRGAATIDYPNAPVAKDPAARGGITLDIDKCIFCTLCVRTCPAYAINVDKELKEVEIKFFSCVLCAACTYICPKKCIYMQPQLNPPSSTITTERFIWRPKEAEEAEIADIIEIEDKVEVAVNA